MKYINIINIIICLLICGCQKPEINVVETKTFNNNNNFSAGRAEGLNAPLAFPDYGVLDKKALSESEEEKLILNKWQ